MLQKSLLLGIGIGAALGFSSFSLLHKAGAKSQASESYRPEPELPDASSASEVLQKEEILKNIDELKSQLDNVQTLMNKLE